jgi:hypothetical protein
MLFQRFFRKIFRNLVQEERVSVVASLMSLDPWEHDYHVVQDSENVHGMKLWGQLEGIFLKEVI